MMNVLAALQGHNRAAGWVAARSPPVVEGLCGLSIWERGLLSYSESLCVFSKHVNHGMGMNSPKRSVCNLGELAPTTVHGISS